MRGRLVGDRQAFAVLGLLDRGLMPSPAATPLAADGVQGSGIYIVGDSPPAGWLSRFGFSLVAR